MADSNSQPPRCPCGFWGSPQTMGLCSKCFKEHQKKVEHVDQSNPNADKTQISADSINKALSSVQPMDTSAEVPVKDVSNGTSLSAEQPSGTENPSDMPLSTKKLDNNEVEREEPTSESTEDVTASTSKDPSPGEKREKPDGDDSLDDRPPQKNKKRCFQCNCKLELAIRQIGKCRCDYVFCQLHRLPEQHNCIYDHKEKGRQEARDKMISPKKHIGTSLKRIDSDS